MTITMEDDDNDEDKFPVHYFITNAVMLPSIQRGMWVSCLLMALQHR